MRALPQGESREGAQALASKQTTAMDKNAPRMFFCSGEPWVCYRKALEKRFPDSTSAVSPSTLSENGRSIAAEDLQPRKCRQLCNLMHGIAARAATAKQRFTQKSKAFQQKTKQDKMVQQSGFAKWLYPHRGWLVELSSWCGSGLCRNRLPPMCDIPSGCCSFTGPWTVTRSSLRMLRRVATFCRPLRPVLLLVSFPRSRSPVVGVLGLC